MKISIAPTLILVVAGTWLSTAAVAQEPVCFRTSDGGVIHADLYGDGERAVVLAHGARFDKESWRQQALLLAATGFRVLAIDFRGYGRSRGPGDADPMSAPLHLDVLASVGYLRETGARTVSVVGASLGGIAAADAAIVAEAGTIDRLVLLAATPDGPPEQIKARTLFVVARDDTSGTGPRLPWIQDAFERATGPKELLVINGTAHAQALFNTEQGESILRDIVRFLSEP